MVDLDRSKMDDVPNRIIKKPIGSDLGPNTRVNHLTVLSMGAQMFHGSGPDDPRHCYWSSSSLSHTGQSALGLDKP
jgi:hypothetical protein